MYLSLYTLPSSRGASIPSVGQELFEHLTPHQPSLTDPKNARNLTAFSSFVGRVLRETQLGPCGWPQVDCSPLVRRFTHVLDYSLDSAASPALIYFLNATQEAPVGLGSFRNPHRGRRTGPACRRDSLDSSARSRNTRRPFVLRPEPGDGSRAIQGDVPCLPPAGGCASRARRGVR